MYVCFVCTIYIYIYIYIYVLFCICYAVLAYWLTNVVYVFCIYLFIVVFSTSSSPPACSSWAASPGATGDPLRPISPLRLFLLRLLDSNVPGNSLWTWPDMRIPPLQFQILLESKPPKSEILARRFAVTMPDRPLTTPCTPRWALLIPHDSRTVTPSYENRISQLWEWYFPAMGIIFPSYENNISRRPHSPKILPQRELKASRRGWDKRGRRGSAAIPPNGLSCQNVS